ncbi:hypothetical protein Pmani_035717 [Petrolisthes manimaculis]|uniref:PHD-type domain-containing protein n=1 Tax=Petrolisthes manimaculis TaxID=1843537 RepID=A0AAE1TQ81_9EUCA|nr:hypothetical protein Pmani_035717 [Petrolisthes manimaculis]
MRGRGAKKKSCRRCGCEGRIYEGELCGSCKETEKSDGDSRGPAGDQEDNNSEDNNKQEEWYQQVGRDSCGVCQKKVRDNDNGLCCEICERWYHCGCIKMGTQEYRMLQQLDREVDWMCKNCKAKVKNLKAENLKLRDEVVVLRLENDDLKKMLNDRIINLEKKVECLEKKNININNTGKGNGEGLNQVVEKVLEVVQEEEEKKARINNLVIYEVEESQKEYGKEREEEDKDKCTEIFERGVGVKGVSIESVGRLGRRMNTGTGEGSVSEGSEY